MKIFDCFQFFDENMILDLRLNILDKYVHKFVIVENLFMHSGKKKKKNFNIKNFSKFKDKIEYILVDELPNNLYDLDLVSNQKKTDRIIDNTLKIEHNQRNRIIDGIKNAKNEDLILIGDVDEIPNLQNIKDKISKKIVIFKQEMFYYKLNLKYNNMKWIGTKGTLKKDLLSPQWLRDVKDRIYPFWRFDIFFSKKKYNNIQHIENGGWHFSNMKTPDALEEKLNNFGHHAEFKESGINLEGIKKMISENRAIYDYNADMKTNKWSGEKKLLRSDINELPDYIKQNRNKYFDWLI